MTIRRSPSVPRHVAHPRNPSAGSPRWWGVIGRACPDADAVAVAWSSRKDGPGENTEGRMPLAIRATGQAGRGPQGDAAVRR